MSDILFIRHAETDMAGTFCGHSDPDLNNRGYAQLASLVQTLRGRMIEVVYTSNLRRARATAEAIAKTFHLVCHVSPALREMNFGEWEGLTWKEVEQTQQDLSQRWLAAFPRLPMPGGEDYPDFVRRVLDVVERIDLESFGRDVIVVTHAGVIRIILRELQGCSEEEAWERTKEYCCIVQHNTAVFQRPRCTEAIL